MKKLVLLFFVIPILNLYSKDQSFGLNFSTFSGMGLSYQNEVNKDFSLKFTAFGYYFGDKPPDEMTILGNFGTEFHYNLNENDNSRTYLLLGGSYWKKEDRYLKIEKINDEIITNKIRNPYDIYNVGLALGYEYVIIEPVKFNCNIGLQYQSSLAPNLGILIDLNPKGQYYIGPACSLGFQVGF